MRKLLYSILVCLTLTSAPVVAQEVINNQSVISMDQAKMSRNLIIEKINLSRCQFDMSTNGLLGLKSVNVPESIMEAMLAVTHPTDVLNNEDIIRLYQAGIGRKLITQKIQSGSTRFNVNTDGMIQLKTAKVPEPIIKIMMSSGAGSSPKPGEKTPANVSVSQPPTRSKTVTEHQNTAVAHQTSAPPQNCSTWNDKFTRKTIRASRVTLRGMKLGATLMNGMVGQGSANVFGIEDMEVDVIFRRDGNNLTLVLYAKKPGSHTMYVSSDKPLMFLMQDDSVMQFMPAEDSEADYSWGSGYSMESSMLMYYQLNPEQVQILNKKLIKEYRLNFYNRKYTQDTVNEGRAMQVRSAAECVLN